MARTLLPSGLWVIEEYGATDWWSRFNTNMVTLNNTRLKLSRLADVNTAGLSNGKILSWNAATNRWVAITPPARKPLSFG